MSRHLVNKLINLLYRVVWTETAIYKCTFASTRMENSEYVLINFRPRGLKIAIYNCKFPSVVTENSQ